MSPRERRYRYYPGCLANESAREYDASIRRVMQLLEVDLDEIDDWNCCGAGIVQQVDRAKGRSLARRNLDRIVEGETILSGCPRCVRCLQDAGAGERAVHVLGAMSIPAIRQRLLDAVRATKEERPLGSLKVVCHYGPDLVHGTVWGKPEEGDIPPPMEKICETVGATVRSWSSKAVDAGADDLFTDPPTAFDRLDALFRDFDVGGADAIVTACPHQHFALDAFQYTVGRRAKRAIEVPVLFVTELAALACGLAVAEKWLARHVASPFPLFDRLYEEETRRQRELAEAPAK